ncbi:hypothetical protein B2A_10319, partial [mine drainage metagenome]
STEALWARSTALGGYREVGRSAHLLTTQNSRILIDCGIDPGSDVPPSSTPRRSNPWMPWTPWSSPTPTWTTAGSSPP